MSTRCGELVATDEPTVVTESLFDAIVMEDSQSDECLADSAGTNEGDGYEVFCQANDLLDQLITSETGPRWRGRGFSRCTRSKYKITRQLVV